MKLLTDLSQWLPHVILIEIGVIVIVGTCLMSLIAWKSVKRWWKRTPTTDELPVYNNLPSAEAFLDDWTMTKPQILELSTSSSSPASEARVGIYGESGDDVIAGMTKTQEQSSIFAGEEIEGVVKTILQVKRDLKVKNEEILTLSKRLVKQQTVNKFAIKEKLMAMRKAELNKRERLMAERKAKIEKSALETQMRSIEMERQKAYEVEKERELEAFRAAKERVEQIVIPTKDVIPAKAGIQVRAFAGMTVEKAGIKLPIFTQMKDNLSKLKPKFNFEKLRKTTKIEKVEKKFEVEFTPETPRSDEQINPVKKNIDPNRKTISVAVPTELL